MKGKPILKISLYFSLSGLFILILAFSSLSYSKNIPLQNPTDTNEKELRGEIDYKKGKMVTIKVLEFEVLPEIGTTGILAKYFEEEVLGINTHGYFNIAEVEVKEVSETEITFKILKELSEIKINGKKENHYKKITPVRFEWTPINIK